MRRSGDLLAKRARHTRPVLAAVALLCVFVFAITLERVPSPSADSDFYASIARSIQLHDIGVPSVMRNSPVAVDHVPFYGPVFFDLAAGSFRLFGVSIWSFRIVSAVGTLVLVLSGGLLARYLSSASDGWLWALTLLLLTPEVAATVTAGTMHTLAVGLEILTLAVFVRGLAIQRGRLWYGATAGVLLTLAALTTPRTYPFIFAFIVAGMLLPCMPTKSRRLARRQWATAIAVLLLGIGMWATISHGNPIRWGRYMTFILTHEDADVAVLPTAIRIWSLSGSTPVTVTFAVIGAGVAAFAITRHDEDSSRDQVATVAFALLTGWITFVFSATVMNLTSVFRPYLVLPLFAVVLAVPYRTLKVDSRLVVVGVASLLICDMGVNIIRYARVAATWSARNPVPLDEFFRAHVPPGSAVMGPEAPYFIAVERSGARYRSVSAASWADWARWVPILEPDATTLAHRVPVARARARFLVWPTDDDLPGGYDCARGHVVALFVPAAHHLDLLGPFRLTEDVGYRTSALYQLAPECPTGYDPSGDHQPSN